MNSEAQMDYQIEIAGTDVRFPCAAVQNILDAALKIGIEMRYSSRKGVCCNCAGRVETGEVESPISKTKGVDERLFCQCDPLSNLVITPKAWHRMHPTARKTLTVKVFRNVLAAPDVSILQLRLPIGQRAKFKASQYLQVTLPDGSRQSYSMANPPHESDSLQLHIRHVPGDQCTELVPHLKSGDTLQVERPFNNFKLQEASPAPMLCVVGGTGFASVKWLLDEMVKRSVRRQVTLVRSARDRHGIYRPAALKRWKKLLPGFTFVAAMENTVDARQLGVFHGRVDEALRLRASGSLVGHEVYCCGSPVMVKAVRRVCIQERGISQHRFFSDVFVPGPAGSVQTAQGVALVGV